MKKTTLQMIIFFAIVIIGLLADSLFTPDIIPKEKRSSKPRQSQTCINRFYSRAI